MLGLFGNALTADAKYSHHNKWSLPQPIKMHLSEKPSTFCPYMLLYFRTLHKIFNILKKNLSLIA